MAKKVLLRDWNNDEVLPITRGELVLDSSGKEAFRSNEFLATTSQPGLMSPEDKYKIINMQASSVADALTLKINNGSVEGTNLYTYNGSAAKTLNIVAGDNITLTPTAGVLSISATTSASIDAYTKAESDNRYLQLNGGGVIKGNGAYSPLVVNADSGQEGVGFRLALKGSNKSLFAWDINTGTYIYDNGSQKYMGIYNGNPYFYDGATKQTLIHLGNIGSYNAGSAIKLQDNTAYTAWGQTFFENGKPKNVDNSLYIGAKYGLFLNKDQEGIYLAGSGIYWHNSSNEYVRGIMRFTSSSNVLIGTTTDDGEKLQVTSADYGILRLTRNKGKGYGAAIRFHNTNDRLGSIGFETEDYFTITIVKEPEAIRIASFSADRGINLAANTTINGHINAGATTITSDSIPLILNRNNGNSSILYRVNGANVGALGFTPDGVLVIRPKYQSNTEYYNIIHSGNINSYTIVWDKSVDSVYSSSSKFNTVGYGNTSNDSGWKGYGPILTFGIDTYYAQLQKAYDSNTLYIRSYIDGTYTDWKTIAFTDSNVASATKLSDDTAYTVWGQTFFKDGKPVSISKTKPAAMPYVSFINYDNTGQAGYIGRSIADSNDIVLLTSDGHLRMYVNNAERMRISTSGNVLIGTTTDSGYKLQVAGNVSATNFIGNLDGTYVNKLTGYTKATAISALADTDTLNTALGKLEYKTDTAYELVKGAYDGDETIENLAEILKVLEGISDTETIQAIVGKYLPLSGGTITGRTNIKLNGWPFITYYNSSTLYGYIGFSDVGVPSMYNGSSWSTLIHTGNYADTTDKRYLQLSGGTVSGMLTVERTSAIPLYIKSMADRAFIRYQIGDTNYSSIGVIEGEDALFRYDANLIGLYRILDSGNYTSYMYSKSEVDTKLANYLPLSGGTLTSANVPLIINRTSGIVTIDYKSNGTTVGYLGFDQDGILIIRPQVQTNSVYYKVLHTGNYAGFTDNRYLQLSGGTLTGGLTISAGNLIVKGADTVTGHLYPKDDGVSILGQGGRRWAGVYTVLINGGTPIHSGNIGSQSVNYANNAGDADTLDGFHADSFVKSYIDSTDNSTRFTDRAFFQTSWIDGQGDFGSLVIPTWPGNKTDNYYTTEVRFNRNSANPMIRVTNPNGTSDWYRLARTVDTVASATKLQTARKIWGQSFDGTWNVSGNLTLAKAPSGGWARVISVNKSDDSILANIGFYGDNDILHYIYIGGTYQAPHLAVFPSGNIGINRTVDSGYKLDIKGTTKMRDNVIIGASDQHNGRLKIVGVSGENVLCVVNNTGKGLLVVHNDGNVTIANTLTTSGLLTATGGISATTLTASSTVTASSFIKAGSTDSYVLLGAGGHKALSDFMLKSDIANQELNNNLTTITKSLTVTADWMDTGIKSTDLATGTYIVQVSVHNTADYIWYCYWSGVMSWYASNTNDADTDTDEIILHRVGHAYKNTIYLRTVMQYDGVLKLQIAANKTLSTAATYTFKFKRVI